MPTCEGATRRRSRSPRHPSRLAASTEQVASALPAEVGKPGHRFVRGPEGVGQEPEVDQRRLNAVALLVRRAADGVPHHRYLEAVFEQVTEMGLDAEVSGRPGHDYLLDASLAELQHQVVGRRTVDLVRAEDDRSTVEDV